MNNITNYGQLKAYLEDALIGKNIPDVWRFFSKVETLLEQVDRNFHVKRSRYVRSNVKSRGIYYNDVYLGSVEYSSNKDGDVKSISLFVGDMTLSWLDVLKREQKKADEEEAEALKILAEHGFISLNDLINYLRRLPSSKKQEIRNQTY